MEQKSKIEGDSEVKIDHTGMEVSKGTTILGWYQVIVELRSHEVDLGWRMSELRGAVMTLGKKWNKQRTVIPWRWNHLW